MTFGRIVTTLAEIGANFARRLPRRAATLRWVAAAALLGFGGACDVPQVARIGTNVWPGYEPLYLARNLGYLDKEKFKLVEYSSARDVSRAFANGSIEIAALTLDETLLLLQRGVPLKVFLVADISDGADSIVAQPGIQSVAELKGKRVAVEIGAVGSYVLRRALEKHGISAGDVTVVPLSPDEHVHAFESRAVDAVVTFEPERTRLLALHGKEVFSSREIPDEIVDVLVAHAKYAAAHAELLRDLAQAWFKAVDFIQGGPDAAARQMQRRLGISAEEIVATFSGLKFGDRAENSRFLKGDAAQLPQTAITLRAAMTEMGLLKAAPELGDLSSGAALPEAVP